ncbi:phenylalanine--tRNA ligase subunit beta [Homoserinibacter sp. GY 40078]|uniref:phenylalanine--tRNA ligase subunit beta n=1 Tax=Homoserinibacter sp. GY 40078 TaxID=2603275 RepID=UPI0011CB78F9|nr:phenylalanine--tRNA ligase subunit beta [Homoserinibacter sp. GY 40078]TXK19864.1 phenylalanine--tRNA ligase subunit beta [Homoserinibacter sp. GY 40078]
MRVPISWLGEWVDLPEDVTLEHLHAALVKVGLEEEDTHGFALTGPIVVGRVLEATPEPQSNGKTINWCQVDVGEAEPRGIVCGAHNFAAGDKVVVTLPGAVLPGPFPIAARKTYGHVSDGMIASARELGLGDEHDGILRLADLGLDPEVGVDAISLLGLDDAAVEVNVTPDRGYAFSIRGIAREYSHSTGAAFRDPADAVEVGAFAGFPVVLDDQAPIRGREGCSVFSARVVRGIDATRPTPPWMSSRLRLAGIRSVSLAVDITNYVMLELGQPIHGYDLAKVDPGGLVVRRAQQGESLETLDGKVRSLDPADMVVADATGPLGLGGVMGGAFSELSTSTTDVLVEAAVWDPISIARTVRRHKLPSEAAKRYERGVDPRMSTIAVERVAQLLVDLAGGTRDDAGVVIDRSVPLAAVVLPLGRPAAVVGVEYSRDEVVDVLRMIGAEVSVDGDLATVTPPSWRPDLVDDVSLVEEVARITGYDRIPAELPIAPAGRGLTRSQLARRRVAQTLAAAGATEVLSYPFVSDAVAERFEPGAASVRLANALDATVSLLRRTLLPGLVDIAHRNLSRGLTDLALVEIGAVFRPESGVTYGTDGIPVGAARPGDQTIAELNASIPPQERHVAGLFLGDALAKQPGSAAVPAGIADALDAVQQVALAVGIDIRPVQGAHPALHPGRTAELRVGDRVVGVAGELLPALAAESDLPRVVAVFELDLDLLIELSVGERSATPIGTLPAATQDLSLVVAADVPAAEVRDAIVAGAGELLEHIRLVDDYRGQGVEAGTKSLTFALRFRAADRTLTAAEATDAKLAGLAVASERVGATLRE